MFNNNNNIFNTDLPPSSTFFNSCGTSTKGGNILLSGITSTSYSCCNSSTSYFPSSSFPSSFTNLKPQNKRQNLLNDESDIERKPINNAETTSIKLESTSTPLPINNSYNTSVASFAAAASSLYHQQQTIAAYQQPLYLLANNFMLPNSSNCCSSIVDQQQMANFGTSPTQLPPHDPNILNTNYNSSSLMNVNNAYCSPNNYFYQPTFPQLYSASMMPRYGFFPSLSGGFSEVEQQQSFTSPQFLNSIKKEKEQPEKQKNKTKLGKKTRLNNQATTSNIKNNFASEKIGEERVVGQNVILPEGVEKKKKRKRRVLFSKAQTLILESRFAIKNT
uniref:Uncharacterized protein n=1 Tax=Meloidogyne enterolobii TaxID=390850 RepID=A0A6V7U529_MELEN|nr:unnamed protein product [Meloidogyne enterolobii]